MPSFALRYRLRIRNASTTADPNGTADALTFTSVRGGTNPYILEAPSGDGQSVDPLTGETVDGSYTVLVADPVTGTDGTGTLRLVTNALEDASFRQQLLSRRAYLEMSEDGGSTWTRVLIAGYVTALKLLDATTFAWTIGDSRRIEQYRRAFTWSDVPGPLGISERDVFPKRGCLIGGPIIGGLGRLADAGGWEFTVTSTQADPSDGTLSFLKLALVAGYVPPFFQRVRDSQDLEEYADLVLGGYAEPYTGVPGFTGSAFTALGQEFSWHPALTVALSQGASAWTGTLFSYGRGAWYVRLDAASSVSPPSGSIRMRIYTTEVSERSPVYADAHPVDLVTDLFDTVGIGWDATTAAAVRAALGEGLRYVVRITEPLSMADFLARAVFGPFGFAVRNGADGEREFFLTRRQGTAAPSGTIATADVPDDDVPSVFDLKESTVVTAFRLTYRTLTMVNLPGAVRTARRRGTWPPDGIDSKEVSTIIENADVSTFSTREVAFDLPGMVRNVESFSPAMAGLIAAITLEGFDRYGRGAIEGEALVLRGTSAAEKTVGDEVNVALAHVPSRGYRVGESSVAARIMQVLQRTEVPEGAILRLLDSGVDLQPVTPAPTITIAAATGNPRTLATFHLTNAAALNAAAVLTTAVEWATGASAPSGNGQLFARYAPGTAPTGDVLLPPVVPGTKLHVRARTEQTGRRSSAWTAWQSVTLTAFSAPTGVAASGITAESAVVTWTPANGVDECNVYLFKGTSAPGSWDAYLVQALPGGSTRAVLRGLESGGVDYLVGVAHRDPGTGAVTAVVTDAFVTATNSATADPLRGFAVIPCDEDAGFRTGIALALYPSNDQRDIVIERAPDASGAPGTWEALVRLPGGTPVFVDWLPSDGATRWYRSRHEVPGQAASAWSSSVSATPGGVPADIERPIPVAASLEITYSVTTLEYVITWSGQGVQLKIDNGTYGTPPSSPITVIRGAVAGGLDVRYTFRSIGTLGDVRTESVLVKKADYIIAPDPADPSVDTVSFSGAYTPGDGGGSVDVSWTASNVPGGATYNVEWSVVSGDPISSGSGTVTGATSGGTITAALGANCTFRARVMMYDGATLVAEKTLEQLIS